MSVDYPDGDDRAVRQRPLSPRIPGPRPEARDLGRDRRAPAVRRAGAEPGPRRDEARLARPAGAPAPPAAAADLGGLRPAQGPRGRGRIWSRRPRRRSMRSTGRRRPRTTSPASRRSRASRRSGNCRRSRTIPPGLTDAQRRSVIDADAALVDALRGAAGALPAAGADRAHRPRAYRSRLALALCRDPPQGAPHLPHRAVADGRRQRVPRQLGLHLQPVDRAVLRADRGGRSGAVRAHPAPRSRAGSWETVGGLWVEPDTNMPTGESLARQVLYGQRYFEQKFGVAPHGLLAARLLRLFRRAAADPEAGRHHLVLHHQGQLERDQQIPGRPLLVGRARWQPRARAHLRESVARLQRRGEPRMPLHDLEEFQAASPSSDSRFWPSATATAAAA